MAARAKNVLDVEGLPVTISNPITLKRYPDGSTGQHFYEKNARRFTPNWVETFAVVRRKGGPDILYVVVNDLATLVWSANLANLEIHPLLERAPEIERPASVVFDLDPGAGADVLRAAEVAFLLKSKLEEYGLESVAKAKRGGKVFIDWSQNSDFKTTVSVYSLRARRERPYVSPPFTWQEFRKALKKEDPTMLYVEPEAAIARLEKKGDLFEPVLKLRQKLGGRRR